MSQSADLRKNQPTICSQLDLYKSHLAELQTTLNQIRVMPLGQPANLLAGRAQLDAATHWLADFQATR